MLKISFKNNKMGFSMKLLYAIMLAVILSPSVLASELYQITLLRAAPGNLTALLQQVKAYKGQQKCNPS